MWKISQGRRKADEQYSRDDDHVKSGTVSVSYTHLDVYKRQEKKLIEDFNLEVKEGQRIAIVGPTGCGKTTMINLLMRFYDVDSGAVKIEGKDIRALTRRSLRSSFGMVLQDTWIRSGTIRDNICMGYPDASEEEMICLLYTSHFNYSLLTE